ncbi:ComEA family DNA-binding protein [Bizionia saleffrena]|uniref:ComEA family DNA-binding protein n=1 Tax=Bizionia saleffrena TaxID=291189 RepID=UPI001FECF84C|nr:helix-hairpin-helix domain-containing protein [Bizionia saleffrena]
MIPKFFATPESLVNDIELQQFYKEMDSLKAIAIQNKQPKRYPFNPNYIQDYKGYTLGMTLEEIDRLLAFRAQNKWVNSDKEFQKVTQVSDSLLAEIAPYFKFPEWVTRPKSKTNFKTRYSNAPKTDAQKEDLNTASALQLQNVYGVGEKLSERIIKYRTKQVGFVSLIELQEIYGLSPEVIENIKNNFSVKTPKTINRVNLNTATSEELVTIKYIDYEIAFHIIEQRILRNGFKNYEELTKVKDFPLKKIEIIKLYLAIN